MAGGSQSWLERFDSLVDRVRSELAGPRGRDLRRRMERVRNQAEEALNSQEAQRVRSELTALRSQARGAVNEALSSKSAQDIAGRIDSVLTDLEERVRSATRDDKSSETKRDKCDGSQ